MQALVPFVIALLWAQASPQAMPEVDAFVEKQIAAEKTPGVSIAIVRDGKVVYAKGYGFADLEHKAPATPQTVYELGSVTKQFTASLLMQLVQEGKVKLDESARTYLQEIPAAWTGVTVRHLLTHTSGIKSYTDVEAFGLKMREPATAAGLFSLISGEKPDFAPGEGWKYNNSAYFLLGLLIEKAEGKPFREVLRRRILEPLGMTRTDMNDPAQIVPNRARGYLLRGGKPANAEYIDMGWPFAAGAMISTVEDMAKWDAALYGEKVLKQSSLQEMWTPVKLNNGERRPYGFGWALGSQNGSPVVEHGGAIPGFCSMITRFPEKRLTIIVLANGLPFGESAMAHGIAGIVEPSLKESVKAIADTDIEATKLHRTVFEELVAGTLKPDLFTEEMRKVLFPGAMDQMHRQFGEFGKPSVFELVDEKKGQGVRARAYHVVIGPLDTRITFVTNAEGKIAGMRLGG